MAILQLIFSFLGGGIVVVLLNWIKEVRSLARQREIAYVQDQLKLLYGPLHYLVSKNVLLMELHHSVEAAYRAEFEGQRFSEESQPEVTAACQNTIELMNAYSAKYNENNLQIEEVLEKNWSLADEQDNAAFSVFLRDRLRVMVETQDQRFNNLPFGIRHRLGPVAFVRSEFVELVNGRWREKSNRLKELQYPGKFNKTWAWIVRNCQAGWEAIRRRFC